MALNKQIYLYSVCTDSFFEAEEQRTHEKLLKLFELRKILKNQKILNKNPIEVDTEFWGSTVNKLIAQEKEMLVEKLNQRLSDRTPRQLNPNALKDKAVIALFESALTRALGIPTSSLTEEIMVLTVFYFQVFEGLVKDGFIYNGEKYIFLTASAGQIRTKKAVFVKESSYQKIRNKIMCGLTVEDINAHEGINPN